MQKLKECLHMHAGEELYKNGRLVRCNTCNTIIKFEEKDGETLLFPEGGDMTHAAPHTEPATTEVEPDRVAPHTEGAAQAIKELFKEKPGEKRDRRLFALLEQYRDKKTE